MTQRFVENQPLAQTSGQAILTQQPRDFDGCVQVIDQTGNFAELLFLICSFSEGSAILF